MCNLRSAGRLVSLVGPRQSGAAPDPPGETGLGSVRLDSQLWSGGGHGSVWVPVLTVRAVAEEEDAESVAACPE